MTTASPRTLIEVVGIATPGPVQEGLVALTDAGGQSPAPLVPDLGTLALFGVFGGLFLLAALQALYTLLRDTSEGGLPERR